MRGYSWFAIAVTARAALVGALVAGATYLLVSTQLYATAASLLLLVVALTFDLARTVARTDRSMEDAMATVLSGTPHLPARHGRVFARCMELLERATAALETTRFEQQRRISHLQALLETAPVALIVIHVDGRLSAQNHSARQLLGSAVHAANVLVGRTGSRFAGLSAGMRQIVQLHDGRRLLASAAQFSQPGSEPQLLVGLHRLTGELDVVELLAWQEMARVLTHEMMNSLTPIASLSESLGALAQRAQQGGTAQLAEMQSALEVIKRRSVGLMSFVERYRTVAELPQPKLELIDATTILAGIDKLMSARCHDLGIACRTDVIPAGLRFSGDPQLLEQAIINLLSNACDAVTGVPDATIEVRCELHEQRILLTVRDNGVGLRTEHQEQIFVPFFTTKPGGSGIGLSLARQIAVAHGGTLDARAVQPRGVLLSMSLPQSHVASEAAERAVSEP